MVTWVQALKKTRQNFSGSMRKVFTRKEQPDTETLEELEETLIQADIQVGLVGELIKKLESGYGGLTVSRRQILSQILSDSLGSSESFNWNGVRKPLTILLVGVNGSGKTTTAAKLARRAAAANMKPLLAAADTFRAAGTDQLRLWGEKVGCEVVSGKQGSDSAAVAYDALDAGLARAADVVIIDTAGRMHTKQPLMNELSKLKHALSKRAEGKPDETWIVLDASLGQNALAQAKVFHEATPLTGVIVAKLDGSSKGGFLFSIKRELGVPVRFVGLGEGEDDLVPFDTQEFVDAILGNGEDAG